MHNVWVRRQAIDLLADGVSRREVCRRLGVSYNSTYRWQARLERRDSGPRCFRCDGANPHRQYGYLLGQYFGDGHIGRSGRTIALRIYCCDQDPGIIEEVATAMLPQLGTGMKHTRPIVLTSWQQALVEEDPRPLIRGLIHSDGCRSINTVHRQLRAGRRTYRYPRYLFSNMSVDIQGIFTDALDQLGIAWRRNRFNSVSVARREAVAALDEFAGPKT